MARLSICLCVVGMVLCQTVYVFSRQVDFDIFDTNFNSVNNQAVTTSTARTTTLSPPEFTNCMNACPVLPQYNPVCGTDGVSYANEYRLRCAQSCGLDVQELHIGTCGRSNGGRI